MAATTPPPSEEEFKEQLQNGRMIESVDEMTEGYKEALKIPLQVNADIELMSAPCLFRQAMNAPSLDARTAELSTIQDEVGHAWISFRLLQNLGEDVNELIYEREPHEWSSAYGFEMYLDNFADQTVFHAFLDQAGLVLLADIHENTSYGPWKRALVKVDKEEQFHIRHGRTWFRRLANKDPETKAKIQESVDWLFPIGLELFGVPDEMKSHFEQLEYRIKGLTNDELRQVWLGEVVPLCEENDIDVPAHYDESADAYVLDFDWPVALDPETQRFRYDEPVSWDQVLERWQAGGPALEEYIRLIQEGDFHGDVVANTESASD